MRHTNKILFKLMLVSLTFTSCSKFLDVNTDPNRVTDANITPELLFTQAENAVGTRMAGGNFLFFDHWVGYSGQNGTFAPQQNEISYNIDFSFGNAIFVNNYNVMFDLYQAKTKALALGKSEIAAASMILLAKQFQETTDLYGNIPYSQAFQVNKYSTPTYDKSQDIYNDLQTKLDSAIGIFETVTVSNAFKAADVIAGGNADLWIKFANTLKLRLAIRQSEVPGFDGTSIATQIYAHRGPLGAGESVTVNPGYSNDVNKQNPFYANFGWTPTGVVATSSDNANNYIVTQFGNDADPRLGRFFYPVGFTGSTFAGAVYGDDVGNIPTASGLSYFGPALVGTINTANQGDGTGAKAAQWIMPSYESLFFVAEATARKWITGDAKLAYEAAVKESFAWTAGTSQDTVNAKAYLINNANANFDNAGATPESQAKFIAYQKYLANTMVDPLESFFDINRLNMLTDNSYISVFSGRLSNTLPVRLLYPQSEYTTNSTNVLKEGTINQFTSKLFWEP